MLALMLLLTLVLRLGVDSGVDVSVHVGDGVAIIFNHEKTKNFVISEPHNGEYVNETYFITMKNWEKNLRIKKFSNFDSIFLMTDGITPLATLNNSREPNYKFLLPLINYIKKNQNTNYMDAINNTLNLDKVKKISSDDKTILFLIKDV